MWHIIHPCYPHSCSLHLYSFFFRSQVLFPSAHPAPNSSVARILEKLIGQVVASDPPFPTPPSGGLAHMHADSDFPERSYVQIVTVHVGASE